MTIDETLTAAEDDLRAYVEQLKGRLAELEAHNADATEGKALDPGDANREYRDRLFRFIFGRTENRRWALDL